MARRWGKQRCIMAACFLTSLMAALLYLALASKLAGVHSGLQAVLGPDVAAHLVDTSAVFQTRSTAPLKLDAMRGERWIVVTSISLPTADLKFLASLPGWHVVVAGDAKTPDSWQYPNCVFLGLKRQRNLGLETVGLLPEGSYSRKNAGFLYAIAHGAHVIYETDDDNRPLDVLRNFLLTPTTSGLIYAGKDRFNPYRHFGQATLWPRGYPLGDVGEEPNSSYVLGQWKTPSIQQGLVNGDPDVDAIFRLTRKKTLQVLNVTFDGSAPLAILPRGVFSPFNSQNTLFLQDALWATLIPVTTTFRMCDIWRGYWAQRLLWEIGGTLAFLAPNAFQRRNPHSYMADAANEEDMYFQTQDLIAFLKRWQCNSSLTFFGCVERLSLDMADARFWGPRDAMLAETWVRDLRRINYTEPERVCRQPCVAGVAGSPLDEASEKQKESRNEPPPVRSNGVADTSGRNVRVHRGDAAGNASHEIQIAADKANARVQFWASDQEPPTIHKAWTMDTPMWKHVDGIRKLCPNESIVLPPKIEPTPPLRRRQSDILLVVVFNFYHYDNIPTLHAMYSYHFLSSFTAAMTRSHS